MPRRLLVIGILFCLAGVLAIWGIIVAFTRQSISFNLAVLLLPVGIGLLQGRMWARRWADVALIVDYVFCGLLLVAPLLWPNNSHVDLFDFHVAGYKTWPYFAVAALLLACTFYLLRRLLYSAKVTAYLERGQTAPLAPGDPSAASPPQG